jgi:hypothetical protein
MAPHGGLRKGRRFGLALALQERVDIREKLWQNCHGLQNKLSLIKNRDIF